MDALAVTLAHISGVLSFKPHRLITSDKLEFSFFQAYRKTESHKRLMSMILVRPGEIQDVSCALEEINRNLSSNSISTITEVSPKRNYGCLL